MVATGGRGWKVLLQPDYGGVCQKATPGDIQGQILGYSHRHSSPALIYIRRMVAGSSPCRRDGAMVSAADARGILPQESCPPWLPLPARLRDGKVSGETAWHLKQTTSAVSP